MLGVIMPKQGRGIFICLEGGEGSGKTTMAAVVCQYLTELGRIAREVSDPGSTPLAQRIREIVVDATIPCTPSQQALLYIAARDALADEVTQYLDIGEDVVSGRWTLSTLVYQGALGSVGIDKVDWLTKNFISAEPDIYILLNASPEVALQRKQAAVGDAAMGKDRFDSRSLDWHRDVRNAYYLYAEEHGYPIIDADRPLEEVKQAVIAVCQANPTFRQLMQVCTTGG